MYVVFMFVSYKEGFELPITQAVSANQNVTNTTPRDRPADKWQPCLADRVKHCNRAEDRWIQVKKKRKKKGGGWWVGGGGGIKISNGAQ